MSNKEYNSIINAEAENEQNSCDNVREETRVREFDERDLHPLLAVFTRNNPHFLCYAKTIFHENSRKRQKGYNEWLHPDMMNYYQKKNLSNIYQKKAYC